MSAGSHQLAQNAQYDAIDDYLSSLSMSTKAACREHCLLCMVVILTYCVCQQIALLKEDNNKLKEKNRVLEDEVRRATNFSDANAD